MLQFGKVVKMAKKRKQSLCRICKKNPRWQYKNSDGTVCKRCYHKYVWEQRASARKLKQVTPVDDEIQEGEELIFDGYTGNFYPASQYPWW